MREYRKLITVPNILTFTRILCAIGLIFAEPMGTVFLVLYLACGVTDAVDGTIARITKTASDFGAKLDSVADLLFYSIMVLRLIPVLVDSVSGHIWFAIIAIVIIRIAAYLYVALKYHTMLSTHTYLNKLTGFTVFCLPFVIGTRLFGFYSILVCIIATIAAVYELVVGLGIKKDKDVREV